MEWISVEEKLPEVIKNYSATVLVFLDYRPAGGTSVRLDRIEGEDWEKWPGSGDITHWMPLPDPPEVLDG